MGKSYQNISKKNSKKYRHNKENISFLTTKILTSLYYSLIYPHLTYGNIVWASNYQTRTKSLVTLQKKVIRIIKRQKRNDHTQPIFEELGIMKFENLNTYLIGLFTYKLVYNLIPSPVSNYFTKREHAGARLFIESTREPIYSFLQD